MTVDEMSLDEMTLDQLAFCRTGTPEHWSQTVAVSNVSGFRQATLHKLTLKH